MKALKVLGLAVMFGLMASGISLAGDLKIAYVDLSKVFDGYRKTKEFDAVLQSEGQAFQKERDAMVQKIQDAQSRLDLMKDSGKEALKADIEKQVKDVKEFDNDKRTQLAKKRDDKVREILTEIQNVAGDLAKREGYAYVLNDRVMIYGEAQFNVTDEVLKTLNDRYRK